MILYQTIQNATFPIRKALLLDKWFGKGNSQKANDDVKTAGWLELHNGKLLRAVLRGEGGRKASDLPSGININKRFSSISGWYAILLFQLSLQIFPLIFPHKTCKLEK